MIITFRLYGQYLTRLRAPSINAEYMRGQECPLFFTRISTAWIVVFTVILCMSYVQYSQFKASIEAIFLVPQYCIVPRPSYLSALVAVI